MAANPVPELRPVRIVKTDEPWTLITLEDGTVIRVRLNITKVSAVFVDGEHHRTGDRPDYDIRWVAATDIVETESPHGKPN